MLNFSRRKKVGKSRFDRLTSLNLHELLYGFYRYTDQEKRARVLLLDVIDFTKEDATLSARLEMDMEKRVAKKSHGWTP